MYVPNCKRCLVVLFVVFGLFQSLNSSFSSSKYSCSYCANNLFFLLSEYELIHGEYFDQSDCKMAHIRWITIS